MILGIAVLSRHLDLQEFNNCKVVAIVELIVNREPNVFIPAFSTTFCRRLNLIMDIKPTYTDFILSNSDLKSKLGVGDVNKEIE